MYMQKAAILAFAVFLGTTGFASADRKDAAEREALRQAKFSLNEAIAIAQRAVPGGTVIDTDLETTRGVVQYAIEIDHTDGVKKVFVDLQTGDVIRTVSKKQEDDEDDEDDDDGDD
jgi:uncharacterized membrane protein YkoI